MQSLRERREIVWHQLRQELERFTFLTDSATSTIIEIRKSAQRVERLSQELDAIAKEMAA